jgi:thiamine kinase-like enzyme
MSPEVALTYINAAKSTTYTLVSQYSGGENQGAYRVVNGDGTAAVLKLSKNPMWRKQIDRAKAATDRLRPLGYPVPKYLYIDAMDTGTFWLESEMPGLGNTVPTLEQIVHIMDLIDLQKGQLLSELQGQDWSWYVLSTVFRGEGGLVRSLMKFSSETSALVSDIEGLVRGLDGHPLGEGDLVHGDFSIGQVLFAAQKVSAVLDWDQAGYGDRTMDLVGLWYSLMNEPASRDLVYTRLLRDSSPESIKILAAYKMLEILTTEINKLGGDAAPAIAQAKAALEILHAS